MDRRPFSHGRCSPLYNNQFDAVDRREFAAFLASYGVHEVLVERDALAEPQRAGALVSGAGWRLAFSDGSVDVYLPNGQPPRRQSWRKNGRLFSPRTNVTCGSGASR